jgi:thiol-disulfide isomerase/thioredoxin
MLLSAAVAPLWQNIRLANASHTISAAGIGFQWLIMLAGVVVTALLLWYEVDKNNPVLQKVCTGIAKGNCAAILTGNQAKLLPWLSWSEVGFFYFSGGFLALLFAGNTIAGVSSFVAWLNILALPYTVFSVYYQWRIARQWCILCLCVQGLLLLGAISIFSNHLLDGIPFYSTIFLAKLITCYALPMLVWYAVKPYLLGMRKAKNTKREYLRIKFNAEIFNTLLAKQKNILVPTDGIGIELGNPHAENSLVKVCNPYCGPCSRAHPKIEKLLEANQNLKVKIIFSTPNANDHPSFQPVNHLMAIAGKAGAEEKIKKALDDWYLEEKKDYNQFAAKYPMNGELQKQGGKIEAMYQWCELVGIQATPTIFLNGHQLPDAYDVEDLQYFLLE